MKRQARTRGVLLISLSGAVGLLIAGWWCLLVGPGAADRASAVIRFDLRSMDLIVVDVEVAGAPRKFLLDTGASDLIFDRTLRGFLGPALASAQARTPQGSAAVSVHRPVAARLGPFDLSRVDRVVSANLGTIRRLEGLEDIAGIVGLCCLRDHVVGIDFERRTLEIGPPRSALPPGFLVLAMPLTGDQPTVRLDLPIGPRDFLIDTGSNRAINLARQDFEELERAGWLVVDGVSEQADLTGSAQFRTARLAEFRLGGRTLRGVSVVEDASPRSKIGVELLKAFEVVLDFPGGRCGLRERPTSGSGDPPSTRALPHSP